MEIPLSDGSFEDTGKLIDAHAEFAELQHQLHLLSKRYDITNLSVSILPLSNGQKKAFCTSHAFGKNDSDEKSQERLMWLLVALDDYIQGISNGLFGIKKIDGEK